MEKQPVTNTMKWRALSAIAAAGSLLALAACSSGAPAASDHGPLSMYTWVGSEGDRAQWDSFIKLGKAVDPTIPQINFDGPSFDDYWTKVKTRLQGSNPPCILTTQAARAQELKNLLMPLDDLIKKYKVNTSELDQSMLKGMTVDGKVRAISYDAEPMVLFYNADSFKKAGLQLPSAEYSRDQFLADAKKLTKPGHYALAIETGNFFPNAWTIAGGAEWVKNGQLDLQNPKLASELQSYFDLVNKEHVAKAPEAADDSAVQQQAFTGGKVDMLIEGPWNYGGFKDAAKFNLGVTVVPTPDGKAQSMTAGSGFGIAANCKRPDDAFKAIVAMTSQKVLEQQAAKLGIVPARPSALHSWADGKTPEAAEAVKASLDNGIPQITTPTWNQVSTLFTQYSIEGYQGTKTAEEILKTINDSVQG
jgi:multiple sugar transport system substrate-binding protein